MERESMDFDVVVVGAGPAGLSTACRLRQLAEERGEALSVVVLEKGSEVGAHILSGAVLEPTALSELFPDWKKRGAPLNTAVTEDEVYFLTGSQKSFKSPGWMVPAPMHNQGNYIVSLGNVCRWLGEQAEALGVEIFPGFAAAEVLYREDGSVKGVATGDMGINREGEHKDGYQPGMELHAKYTVFAEGCRGHLGKQLIEKFSLDEGRTPQHYGIGIKELWEVPADRHRPGLVMHGAGWPLSENGASGGFFLYHLEDNLISVGLVTALSYENPYLSPFDEFQRLKHHPLLKQHLEGGTRTSYGARALIKGGFNALPRMSMPGALLIGCDAGTLNDAKIKGSHTAMKSGLVAAETLFARLASGDTGGATASEYDENFKQSWAGRELRSTRNFSAAMHKFGTWFGGAYNYIDQNWLKGKMPFDIKDNAPDHSVLKPASDDLRIDYPKPDGVISFDKLSSVFLSNTNHEEDQPVHLRLGDPNLPIRVNLEKWAEPAQRYCPAGVYEVVEDNGEKRFQINAQNCVHCKTCDIKDPNQNITWVTPEGGGGPNYPSM